MLGEVLQPDISELIENKEFAALKSALLSMEVHDLAELLDELEDETLGVCFRLLPWRVAAEVVAELDLDQQERLLQMLSSQRMAAIFGEMAPDDRTDLLEELPDQLAQRMLYSLRGEMLTTAKRLLAYPEDSIGRLMTPEYVAIREEWPVSRVLEHLRQVGKDKETLNVLYVIDKEGKLLDDIRLERLILAGPDETVGSLMDRQCPSLLVTDDREEAIDLFMKYDQVAMPVVTRHGVLVGIVTVDDVMDVAEEEITEDFQKMSAVDALDTSYYRTTHLDMLRKRLPWLMLLFVAEVFTVVALDRFQAGIDPGLVLLMTSFVPLINACAGNTGSQMSGLMIRSLAVDEVETGDWMGVLGREVLRGLMLGGVLGVMAFVTVLVFGRPIALAVGTGLAMILVMTAANLLGSMLPFLFLRLGIDPAVTSAPFIASLMDISAIMIYFTIAVGITQLVAAVAV
jgi:magnesium transporter